MTDPALQAQVAAARAYESLFVPALFQQWAPEVADLAGLSAGDRVLDVACGTGILAREASRRVGRNGYVAGLDPGAGMLIVARELAPEVDWREGLAESLPFADASFDAVLSQFGLMFMNHRRALVEMLRVLAPAKRLVVAVWAGLDAMPAYAAEVTLLERRGGTEAANALRAPFVLGDPGRLAAIVRDCGARTVAVHTASGVGRFPSARVMVEADLRGWLPTMGVHLTEATIAGILGEAEQALRPHLTTGGAVEFEVRAHLVTASRA